MVIDTVILIYFHPMTSLCSRPSGLSPARVGAGEAASNVFEQSRIHRGNEKEVAKVDSRERYEGSQNYELVI